MLAFIIWLISTILGIKAILEILNMKGDTVKKITFYHFTVNDQLDRIGCLLLLRQRKNVGMSVSNEPTQDKKTRLPPAEEASFFI